LGARLRIRLRPERHRSPADKAQASMDQWAIRKNEPHYQGRDCQTLLLRDPRPAANPPAKLRRRLQLRQAPQNPQGPHLIRIRLQSLDFRATQIQNQPDPANAGTKQLGYGRREGRLLSVRLFRASSMRRPMSPKRSERHVCAASSTCHGSQTVESGKGIRPGMTGFPSAYFRFAMQCGCLNVSMPFGCHLFVSRQPGGRIALAQ
jgi:hypothetical protein